MELFLNIISIIGLVILSAAAWQCWRILQKGKEHEKLNDAEVKAITTRLTVIEVCLTAEVVFMVIRAFLPFIFK